MANKTVKAKYQGQIIEGVILHSRRTQTIETEDNPDIIHVILHRMKLIKPVTVTWDETIKTVSELWVDNNSILDGV